MWTWLLSHQQSQGRPGAHLHLPNLVHVDPHGSRGGDGAGDVVPGEARHLAVLHDGKVVVGPHEGDESDGGHFSGADSFRGEYLR